MPHAQETPRLLDENWFSFEKIFSFLPFGNRTISGPICQNTFPFPPVPHELHWRLCCENLETGIPLFAIDFRLHSTRD